jgi:hypothetical protein
MEKCKKLSAFNMEQGLSESLTESLLCPVIGQLLVATFVVMKPRGKVLSSITR